MHGKMICKAKQHFVFSWDFSPQTTVYLYAPGQILPKCTLPGTTEDRGRVSLFLSLSLSCPGSARVLLQEKKKTSRLTVREESFHSSPGTSPSFTCNAFIHYTHYHVGHEISQNVTNDSNTSFWGWSSLYPTPNPRKARKRKRGLSSFF